MEIQKFQRKPFPVEGVRVTKENMQEVAEWCKGEVKVSGKKTKYIFIDTHRPMTDRQTQAYVGDWILFAERGFKIYTQNAFARNFELVEAGTGKDHADFEPVEYEKDEPLDLGIVGIPAPLPKIPRPHPGGRTLTKGKKDQVRIPLTDQEVANAATKLKQHFEDGDQHRP